MHRADSKLSTHTNSNVATDGKQWEPRHSHWAQTALTCHQNQNNNKKKEKKSNCSDPLFAEQHGQPSQKTSADSEQTEQQAEDEQERQGTSGNKLNALRSGSKTQWGC